MLRAIVKIDEELCDGCGLCVPSCQEGAIRMEGGKARLVSDRLCDGLGACLGHCPRDAITIEEREAEGFDEELVALHLASAPEPAHEPAAPPERSLPVVQPTGPVGGCPGSRFEAFRGNDHEPEEAAGAVPCEASAGARSELSQWPVQLHLLPPTAPAFRGRWLLVAADCVPFALADFHQRMLRDHALAIGCPKLDGISEYTQKLAVMMRSSGLEGIRVAHMEVPCCLGILEAVLEARELAGTDIPVRQVVVSTRGEVLGEREIPPRPSPRSARRNAE